MPWSNNTGGGGDKGPWGNQNNNGGGGGPWGGGPSGGGRGGNQPPDLEDIFRKGQDRLKQVLPNGSDGQPNKFMYILVILLLAAFWLYQCFYQLKPDQLGVELLFGKPKVEISEAGLHFHFWPVETVEIVQVTENQITIGRSVGRGSSQAGLMLSGDQNIVQVEFSALWQVTDPAAFLFNIANPEEMVRKVSESAMREVVGRRPADDIFRDDKAGVAEQVRAIAQETLDSYASGITVNGVALENIAPPREVADAFDEVQRAKQNEVQFIEEANRYANNKLGSARGEAAQVREVAAAYKKRTVEEATGESQRFISVYDEYAKAPEVTRKRLFIETMERVLQGTNKVILGSDGQGQGVIPYLPLPEIKNRSQNAQSANQ